MSHKTVTLKDFDELLKNRSVCGEKSLENYQIAKKIGKGTFGKVKLGIHKPTWQKVAIKVLKKEKITEKIELVRVEREIDILKLVYHTNIIQLYQIVDTKDKIYLIMEYINGGEFFNYIANNKKLDEITACKFFHQIVEALIYCHINNIIHRDLKPENILLELNSNGDLPTIKIIDFGLSIVEKPEILLKTSCGSPCYAAPEMMSGKPYLGTIADYWSLGCILYAMTCGYLPFEDSNNKKLYNKILEGTYEYPEFLSENIKKLIGGLLKINPNERYTIREIGKDQWYKQLNLPLLSFEDLKNGNTRNIDNEVLQVKIYFT